MLLAQKPGANNHHSGTDEKTKSAGNTQYYLISPVRVLFIFLMTHQWLYLYLNVYTQIY